MEEEKLQKILEIAHVAPTAANRQPVRLVVVRSREGLSAVSESANIYGAPVAVVVCADKSRHSQTRIPMDELVLNPVGDILAVLVAFVWACYSLLTRKISSFGYPVILTTRRTFFYGIFFMAPALFFFDFKVGLGRFTDITHLLNFLYLGIGASALCFVTWNIAVKALGAVETSVYIYMVPVNTDQSDIYS